MDRQVRWNFNFICDSAAAERKVLTDRRGGLLQLRASVFPRRTHRGAANTRGGLTLETYCLHRLVFTANCSNLIWYAHHFHGGSRGAGSGDHTDNSVYYE